MISQEERERMKKWALTAQVQHRHIFVSDSDQRNAASVLRLLAELEAAEHRATLLQNTINEIQRDMQAQKMQHDREYQALSDSDARLLAELEAMEKERDKLRGVLYDVANALERDGLFRHAKLARAALG